MQKKASILLCIFIVSLLLIETFCTETTNPNISTIILPDQTQEIPLSAYLSSFSNVNLKVNGVPASIQVINSLKSITTITIEDKAQQKIVAAVVNSTFIAFIDESLTFFVGSYQQDSKSIAISSFAIPYQKSAKCRSMTIIEHRIVFSCGEYHGADTAQKEYLFAFDTKKNEFDTKIASLSFYKDLQTTLEPLVTTSETEQGSFAIIYVDAEQIQDQDPWITVVTLSNLSSWNINLTAHVSQKIKVQKLEMTYDGVYIITTTGEIFYSTYDLPKLNPPVLVGDLKEALLGSCLFSRFPASPSLVVFSQNNLYQFTNNSLTRFYNLPQDFSIQKCTQDNDFLYAIAKSSTNNDLHLIVIDFEWTNHKTYLLDTAVKTDSILSVSSNFRSGSLHLFTPTSILVYSIAKPRVRLSNLLESIVFKVEIEGTEQFISVNASVISDLSKFYQADQTIFPINFGSNPPAVSLKDIFIGPDLAIIGQSGNFFDGRSGPCKILNSMFGKDMLSGLSDIKISQAPPRDLSSKERNLTFVFLVGSVIHYIDAPVFDLYSANTLNTQQVCESSGKILQKKQYDLKTMPDSCRFGADFDICILSDQLVHITKESGIIFVSKEICKDIHLWTNSKYNQDVSVCVNEDILTIYNQAGHILFQFGASLFGFKSFIPSLVSSHELYPNLLVMAIETGFVGLRIPFENSNLIPQVLFQVDNQWSENAFLQLTPQRIISAQLTQNVITEWDITDLYHPFMIGKVSLYDFTLDKNFLPFYQQRSNYLTFLASEDAEPYLLTFQPGNKATSILTFSTYIKNILPKDQDFRSIFSVFDLATNSTLFFIQNPSNTINYFYMTGEALIPLPSLTNKPNECLYCFGKTTLKISSNIVSQTISNLSIDYFGIYAEQPIEQIKVSQQPTIYYEKTLRFQPKDLFAGTALEYNITNLTIDVHGVPTKVVYISPPLSSFAKLNKTIEKGFNEDAQSNKISLFSDQKKLFVLTEADLSYIPIPQVGSELIQFNLTDFPSNSKFIAGSADSLSNLLALIFSNHEGFGVYTHPNTFKLTFKNALLKIKVVNKRIFVLVKGGIDLLYVLQEADEGLEIVLTIRSSIFEDGLLPLDFTVQHVSEDNYVAVIVDGSDTIYTIKIDLEKKESSAQTISQFTNLVSQDYSSSSLQITGVQFTQVNKQTSGFKYLLLVKNFHSYHVEIVLDKEKVFSSVKVLSCFVQMPEEFSIGSAFLTDNYFFDLKRLTNVNVLYLYSYPLDLTYVTTHANPGNYSYNEPVQKLRIGKDYNFTNFHVHGSDGEEGTVFVGATQLKTHANSISRGEKKIQGFDSAQQTSLDIELHVFNASKNVALKYNPDLGMISITYMEATQISITAGNSFYNASQVITLDKPLSILNSTYFIIFTVVFTLLFCVACVCFYRRSYKRRESKSKLFESYQEEEDYQRMERERDDLLLDEK